jgi:hypothetical protein
MLGQSLMAHWSITVSCPFCIERQTGHHGVMSLHGEQLIPAMAYLCCPITCTKQQWTQPNHLPASLHFAASTSASGPTQSHDGSHPRHGTHAAALDLISMVDCVMALLT